MKPIGHAGRIRVPVAKTVLDPRHPGRAQVSQPRDLYRRRLLCKNGEPKKAAMSRQVDENVDPVAVDRLGQAGIGHRSHVAPHVRTRLHLPREIIHRVAGPVAKDLAGRPVVPFEQRDCEKRDWVKVEIARYIADAETPLRVRGIAERFESPCNGPFEPLAEILVPGKKSFAGNLVPASEHEQFGGFDIEPARVELSRHAEDFQGFGDARLASEDIPQQTVRRYEPGVDRDRAPQRGFRFGNSAQFPQHDRIVEQDPAPVRPLLQRAFQGAYGRGQVSP